jgi:hypothetical protein
MLACDTQRQPSALACLYHPQLQDKENMARHIASNVETAGKF